MSATGPDEAAPDAGPEGANECPDRFGQLVDLLVYAPIGVLTMVREDLSGVIAAGKNRVDTQLTLAKFLGKLAVRQVRSELNQRGAAPEPTTAGPEPTISAEEPHDHVVTLPEAIIEAVAESPELADADADTPVAPAAPLTADVAETPDLPIEGYANLAASQVVLRLGSLTPAELDAIEQFESTHRSRRTILGKIHQLRAK